ncbi:MAG: MarR family transcriptional regulator [Actinobacteria bacterium]|nr:MarR family transcriptional regulator [Actinomycetota bacterium]
MGAPAQTSARDARDQLHTLDSLDYVGPLRISELAEREGLTQPGMTALINRLEADGLAVRSPDPTDGRAALVSLTESGRARVHAYRAGRARFIGSRLADLADDHQRALLSALPALAALTDELPVTQAGTTVTVESSISP